MTDDVFVSEVDPYIEAVLTRKARSVVLLRMDQLSTVADAFIICSGTSHRQVTAIADSTQHHLRDLGIRPLHVEGKADGQWVLMDYGNVVIHVFHEPLRSFYDLEGLWADAPRQETPALTRHQQETGDPGKGTAL